MAKFHINDAGETGACKASIQECKFRSNGESTGTGVDGHYSSREEATVAAESFMTAKYREVYKGFRRGEREGMDLPENMKKRLIKDAVEGVASISASDIGRVLSKDKNEQIRKTVAENLKSQKLLRDMSDDESARVRKAVAMNSKNRTVLDKLAKDPDGAVRLAAIKNINTPVKSRKAAQAAIKEANIRNLSQSRNKTAPTPIAVSAPAAASAVQAPATQPSDKIKGSVDEGVKEVFGQNQNNGGSHYSNRIFISRERGAAAREIVAKAHGVSISKVKINAPAREVAVSKGDGIHVYNNRGDRVGVVTPAVYSNMMKVQEQLDQHKARGHFGFNPRSAVWTGLVNAHDPSYVSGTGPSVLGRTERARVIEDDVHSEQIHVQAADKKIYIYNSNDLSLAKVETADERKSRVAERKARRSQS